MQFLASATSSQEDQDAQLSIVLSNIRGLSLLSDRGKVANLRDLCVEQKAVGIALTETWLCEGVEDAEIHMEGFNVFRGDRLGREKGGVALYLREDLAAVQICDYNNRAVNAIVVKCRPLDSLIVVVYRPPDTEEEE